MVGEQNHWLLKIVFSQIVFECSQCFLLVRTVPIQVVQDIQMRNHKHHFFGIVVLEGSGENAELSESVVLETGVQFGHNHHQVPVQTAQSSPQCQRCQVVGLLDSRSIHYTQRHILGLGPEEILSNTAFGNPNFLLRLTKVVEQQ